MSEHDPFGGRRPTSHERMAGRPWDASYQEGPAPWDFGGAQPAVVRVAAEGGFTGAVLDAGCGSGENALHIASLGLPVLGVDVAETALALARERAVERGIAAEFAVADAFHLELLGRRFQTVLDCGLFHTFDDEERLEYVASLASVTEHEGTLHLLCFSDEDRDVPHPVSQEDLKTAFTPSAGWNIATIAHDRVRTRFHDPTGAPAWLEESTASEGHRRGCRSLGRVRPLSATHRLSRPGVRPDRRTRPVELHQSGHDDPVIRHRAGRVRPSSWVLP